MSTCERLGSIKATPSSVGTSTPSPKQAQFVRIARVVFGNEANWLSNVFFLPVGVRPEICDVQISPDGLELSGSFFITPGKESRISASAKRFAFATDEWNVIIL